MNKRKSQILNICSYLFCLFVYFIVIYERPKLLAKNEAQLRTLHDILGLNYTPHTYIEFDHIYLTILCLLFLVWMVYHLFHTSKIVDFTFYMFIIFWVGVMIYKYYGFIKQSNTLMASFIFLFAVFLWIGFSGLKKIVIDKNAPL